MKNNDVTRVEFDLLKEDVKGLKNIYDAVNRQTIATEKLALEMKYMREDQIKAEERIKVLEEKPIKRYDNLVSVVISNVIAVIIGAVAALIGIKK